MIVRGIAQAHDPARDRGSDLTGAQVVAVAADIWGEADQGGYRSGDDGSAFVANFPKDMSDYYEVIQGSH